MEFRIIGYTLIIKNLLIKIIMYNILWDKFRKARLTKIVNWKGPVYFSHFGITNLLKGITN